MPDSTAQERRGCCGFMSPGLVSSEPEDVFPACICRVYVYTTYINKYLYTWPATQITGRHAEQSHKQRQNKLILFPALAKQDAGPLVIHRYNVGPFSNWAGMLSLPNNRLLDPSLPTCWHLGSYPPRPLPRSSCCYRLSQTRTRSWPGLPKSKQPTSQSSL